jgi:5-amino-6-(5-phosphoribosylamino)uracil reductase
VVNGRPDVVLSCAMSVDGYIDDAGPGRLAVSGQGDLDRVDQLRAGCDAIMVGAGTVRRDDPLLLVRAPARRAERVAHGLPEHPVKVTLTASGELSPSAQFFTAGDGAKIVYTTDAAAQALRTRLAGAASVAGLGSEVWLQDLLADLARHGVRRLLVEGGSGLLTRFLTEGLADELHLLVAPFFVGDEAAPRFVGPGRFPHHAHRPMRLAEATVLGEAVLLHYLLYLGGDLLGRSDQR